MVVFYTPWAGFVDGHLDRADLGALGLLMLALIVVAIMLGFPTAFTLMGMGVFFGWLAYRSVNPALANQQILDLMVQRAYSVMSNDVLIAIPLFVFMGYLVERANLIEKLFKSLHLSLARVPGALAVATIVTCAIFATATGIVGAVVTLMGLLALPAMLRAGYNIKVAAGAITAGGCLGILIPPSVLLIVYGATAGVSVVKLYAGAFFPGIMLAGLVRRLRHHHRQVEAASGAAAVGQRARGAAAAAVAGAEPAQPQCAHRPVRRPARSRAAQAPGRDTIVCIAAARDCHRGLAGAHVRRRDRPHRRGGHDRPGPIRRSDLRRRRHARRGRPDWRSRRRRKRGWQEPPKEGGDVKEPPAEATQAASAAPAATAAPASAAAATQADASPTAAAAERLPVPIWYWIVLVLGLGSLVLISWLMSWQRLEIFKMLLASFFPLAVMIIAVLGSIVFGLATPTEAAAVGALGGLVLAGVYRYVAARQAKPTGAVAATLKDLGGIIKESSFLTAKTSAMVCWLFVGSSIFSASFALLGGQEIIERWVLSLGLNTIQFMLLSQFIIFILGWPLEWTEIIVIFMPIFIPLLAKFNVDPLFFGLLVALNLQTAFLSPPVAMAAFYLKGVSPPHVTLNQIFAGMMPFMGIQVIALALLYAFPAIGLWLPGLLYK